VCVEVGKDVSLLLLVIWIHNSYQLINCIGVWGQPFGV